MPFLSTNDREFIRERLGRLARPVRLVVFSEPASGLIVPGYRTCETCADTEALMGELAELSDSVELEIVNVRDDPGRAAEWEATLTPTIAISPSTHESADRARVRFLGLPAGYEFGALVETLASAGDEGSLGLEPATLERLAALETDLELKTFVTPT